MRLKLLSKGFPGDLVDAVLADLEREGSLSDDRFMESYARQRAGRGYGALKIRQELRQRGIDARDGKDCGDVDWDDLLQGTYIKKYGNTLPQSPLERAARQRFLARRGYTQDQIAALFRRLKHGDE